MIDITNLTVSFKTAEGEVKSLDSLSLHINTGENAAILGANGSGKSTLVRALCGMVEPVEGQIKILGRDVRVGKFGEDFFGDVGVVLQEPEGQFLMPTVKREIEAVLQNLGLPGDQQKRRFDEIAGLFHLNDMLSKKPENLSGGQMQIVNLACMLAIKPQILILDEPTTYLDHDYKDILMSFLGQFHNDGITIVHITQHSNETEDCDKICILDKGRLTFEGNVFDAVTKSEFYRESKSKYAIVGKVKWRTPIIAAQSENSKVQVQSTQSGSEIILSAKNIKYKYPHGEFVLQIDELNLFKGEISEVIGSNGSGKTTLAFLLAGLVQPTEGELFYNGKRFSEFAINELRKRIGITWQLPDLAMIGPTVKKDIEFVMDNLGIEDIDVSQILIKVGLAGFENRIVDTLSSGEKRKLALAGILATKPSYILLDEPMAFLDPRSKRDLIEIIRQLARDGIGVMVIGHENDLLDDIADRIIMLEDGLIKTDLPASEAIIKWNLGNEI